MRAGTNVHPRAGQLQKSCLVSETKVRDDLAITLDVGPLKVVEQAAPSSDHFQQALPAVMILGVFTEVISEVVDILGENGNLDLS